MAGIHESGAGSRSSFEDSLAFLVLFSEELLDLVPDGIGVLDEQLRVRAANHAFLRAFEFDSLESARGVSLAEDPLMRVPLPDWRDAPLREIVPELLARDESVSLNAVEVRHPASGELRTWSLKVVPWDTEDPRFRRLLLWVHPWTDRRPADASPAPDVTSPEFPAEHLAPDAEGLAPPAEHPAPDADEPVPPAEVSAPGGAASEETSPEDAAELFRLTNLTARLLETLPVGIAVLDGARHVKAASHRLETLFGRAFRRHGPGDRHLFAVFPELRDPAFDAWLAGSPTDRFSHPAIPPGDPTVRFEVEVQSTGSVDDEGTETLLVFHEVEAMQPTPSAPEPTVGGPTPVGPAAILASDNLGRWPQAPSDRLLIVEADSWTRMVLSDALREGGFEDLVFCENPAAVFDTQDPAAFAVILVGLDGDTSGLRALCERLVRDAARVPVLGITDRTAEDAFEVVGDAALAGVLPGLRGKELREVVAGLMRRGAAEDAAGFPAEDVAPDLTMAAEGAEKADAFEVVVLGAGDADVSVLRMLYRVPHVRVRFVFDPDPGAFGLSLSQNLGIPAISGGVSLEFQNPPAAVVLARSGLEEHLAPLGLAEVPRVTRDELELFLVDPASYLDVENGAEREADAGEAATEAVVTEPARDDWREDSRPEDEPVEPTADWDTAGDDGTDHARAEAPATDTEPSAPADAFEDWTSAFETTSAPDPAPPAEATNEPAPEPPPAAAAAPRPAPAIPPAPAARPRPTTPLPAPPPKRPELGAFADPFSPDFAVSAGLPEDDEPVRPNARVESLLEALELLLDFDRFSSHVLKLALDLTNGASGSLMLLQEDRRALRIIAAAGLSDIVVQKTRQRVGEGIAGRVAADGEPLLLVGTIGDERFRQRSERKEIRSSVCAPVIAEGQVIGVLNINSDPTNHPFDETQLRTVAALGRQLGSPLDRSRQLRRMRGRSFELSVRAEIEAIASSQDDMVSRMRRITARLVQMLDIDTCAIWLLDEARHGLTLRAVSGVTVASMDAVTVPVGTGLVGWVANNLRPLVLRNSADDPNDATRLTSTGVPIRWHTELVGVLAVESTSKNTTDDDRLGLLASVASVIGEQIGVSRAYEDSERKVTMLSALSELGVAFAAAQESSNLAKLVTFSASTVLESDVATIRFRRVDAPNPTGTHDFELLASHGGSIGGVGDPLGDLEEYITREVIAKRNPCRDADLPLQDIEPLMQRSNVASFLGAPMMSGRDLVGVVVVYRVQDAIGRNVGYRDEEIEIAMRLADYAAAAAARFVGATEPDDDYDAQH